jgi:quercetin dioxygenase-like cupin family protein
MNQKLKILSEINKKIVDIQNVQKIQLEYMDGKKSSFDLLRDEDVWIQDEEFGGKGSRYKTLKLHNKPEKDGCGLISSLFEGKEGNVIDTHTHRESHLFVCLEGKVKVTIDDKNEFILEKMHTVFVDSYQPHKFEFLSDSQLLIILLK